MLGLCCCPSFLSNLKSQGVLPAHVTAKVTAPPLPAHKQCVMCCPAGVPGITLHTSEDGGARFKAACLPVALRVSCSSAVLHVDQYAHEPTVNSIFAWG
jgi:hypothetical protein